MAANPPKPLQALIELKMAALLVQYPNVPSHAIPKPKYSDKSTNGLTKCCIDYLNLLGYQAERINSTGRLLDKRKEVTDVLGGKRTIGSAKWIKSAGQVGTADISATVSGRSVKIEIKCKATGDNKLSKGQKQYKKKVEAAGGVYLIVRTFGDLYNWIKENGYQNPKN